VPLHCPDLKSFELTAALPQLHSDWIHRGATRLPVGRAWCTSQPSLRPFAYASEGSAARRIYSPSLGVTRTAVCTRAGFRLVHLRGVGVTVACLLYPRARASLPRTPRRPVSCAGLTIGLLRCPAKATRQDCPGTNERARLTLEHPQSGAAGTTDQAGSHTTGLQSAPVILLPRTILRVPLIHSGQPEGQGLPGGAIHRRMALTMGYRWTERPASVEPRSCTGRKTGPVGVRRSILRCSLRR
ncbi:Transcriptional regulator, partial [Giardia duodenalis]